MAGEIKDWEPQVKIKLTVNGQFVTNYFIDFKVITKDGGIEYHEVKGAETMLWRLKWAILHANKENIIEKDAELVIIK